MLVCCDTETHKFRRGYMTPRQVCMSLSTPKRSMSELDALMRRVYLAFPAGERDERMLRKELPVKGSLTHAAWLLDRTASAVAWRLMAPMDHIHWLFHSASYDVRVMIQACPTSTKAMVKAYEERRIWDTVPRAKIMANAVNQLTMQVSPFTGIMAKKGLYTLAFQVMRYFDVDITAEKLDPEAWRERYAELDGVPLNQWPERAVDYALLDSVWPLYVADAQEEYHPLVVEGESTRCPIWDEDRSPPTDRHPEGLSRFTAEVHQARCMIAFDSAAAWGFRSNKRRSRATIAEWQVVADEGAQVGMDHGFVVMARKKNKTTGEFEMKPAKKLAPLRDRISVAYGGVPVKLDLELETCPIPEDERKSANKTWQAWRKKRVRETVTRLKLPDIYSDAGQLQYKAEVLEHSGDKVLEAYAESSSYATYLTKYASMLMEASEVPLTYYIDTMKATMRSSKKNPPYDQPPRKGGFREAHEPRPGWVYVMADYDQAELRAMAQIHHWWGLGNSLRQMFIDGIDPHVVVAVSLLNAEGKWAPEGASEWTYELLVRARKGEFGGRPVLIGQEGTGWYKIADDYRQLAKVANFGFRGGLGPATFVTYARGRRVLGLDVPRATFVRDVWRETCPEDVAYLRQIGDWLRHGPEPENEDDQRKMTVGLPFTGLVRGGVTYTSGANGNFQHLIAAVLAWTGFEVWKEQYTDYGTGLYGCRTVLPLHDEMIIEAPESRAHDAALRLEEVMKAGMAFHLPDVPAAAEATVSRIWSKSAKRTTDPTTGRLVPWEPETMKEAA